MAGAAASDLLDGLVARRLGVAGSTGRYLDPVADKALLAGALAAVLTAGLVTPGELVRLALRDVAVVPGVAWLLAVGRRDVLERLRPTRLGKLTTAAQFAYLLLLWRREPPPLVVLLAATLGGLAGLDYLRRGLRGMTRAEGDEFQVRGGTTAREADRSTSAVPAGHTRQRVAPPQ